MRGLVLAALFASLAGTAMVRGQIPGKPGVTFSSRMESAATFEDRIRPSCISSGPFGSTSVPQQEPQPVDRNFTGSPANDSRGLINSLDREPQPVYRNFTRPPADDANGLITFDNRLARVQWKDRHWQIMAGNVLVKDFGDQEDAAWEAVRLIRELGLTQRGTIGRPWPIMEYWLADGQAPQAGTAVRSVLTFDQKNLVVKQLQGQWCLRDNQNVLMSFGPFADDAARALEVIRRYEFNRVGYVGRGTTEMMFFLVGPEPMPGPTPTAGSPGERPSQGRQAPRVHPAQLAMISSLFPDGNLPGQRVRLDWRRVAVVCRAGHWCLEQDGYALADYGGNEGEAKEALRVLQHYRLSEQCRLGNSSDSFTFYLSNGQAPCGLLFGLKSQAFRPEYLQVRTAAGRWQVHTGHLRIGYFDDADSARQAVEIIQRHRFNHLCRAGDSGPAPLTFLVRDW